MLPPDRPGKVVPRRPASSAEARRRELREEILQERAERALRAEIERELDELEPKEKKSPVEKVVIGVMIFAYAGFFGPILLLFLAALVLALFR